MQQRERVERAIANELRRQATVGVQLELLTGGITLFGVIDIPALAVAVMRACDEADVAHRSGSERRQTGLGGIERA